MNEAPYQQSKLVQKEFSRAADYSAEYNSRTPIGHYFNMRLKRVAELLASQKNGKVLDLGCGPAKVFQVLRARSFEYYGIDISQDMLEDAVSTYGTEPQSHFVRGSIENLPFPDSSFEVILCLGALEYLLDGRAAMAEVARVAKPGATVIVTMQNKFSPYRLWLNIPFRIFTSAMGKLKRQFKNRASDTPKLARPQQLAFRSLKERDLRELLDSCGLTIEDVLYYDFNLFFHPLDRLFSNASVFLSQRLENLSRSPLRHLGTGYIVMGRTTPAPLRHSQVVNVSPQRVFRPTQRSEFS